MKRFDPHGDDPTAWRAEYKIWKSEVAAAMAAQTQALAAYSSAQAKLTQLTGWRDQLATLVGGLNAEVGPYSAVNATLAKLARTLDELEGQLVDHQAACDTATGRLLAGPSTAQPLVLLPVRVHTAWQGSTLSVRVMPGEASVDRHDPRLSPLEQTLGQAYWATRSAAAVDQAAQAWEDITRRVSTNRAAWVIRCTDPHESTPPQFRSEGLDPDVTVRLLPDRFAVVLLATGEPVNVAPTGAAPQFMSWGNPLPRDLPIPLLHGPTDQPWTTDLDAAVASGMAMRLTVQPGSPPIDQLVVVGVRSKSSPADLADLFEHHLYSAGIELLEDGLPTNNSAAARTTRTTGHDKEALWDLITHGAPATCPPGTGGAQLADVLGIPRARVAILPGSQKPREEVPAAVGALIHAAVTGSAAKRFGATPASLAFLQPGGGAPALRIGKQPFGILTAVDTSRWSPGSDAVEQQLATAIHQSVQNHLLPLDVDPAAPPPAPPEPRRITTDDDSQLPAVLSESAASIIWSMVGPPGGEWGGLDQLVGPAAGPQSPAIYLDELAKGIPAPGAGYSFLSVIALAANTAPDSRAAMALLALAAAKDGGRQTIASSLSEHLDALSHRIDAWVTAAASRRRTATATGTPMIGAYGYLTDVAPRSSPRTFGHVHGPSLAHGATAAVLRSGYLGQRRGAWAARLAKATADGDAAAAATAREGLAALSPLDQEAEKQLTMAIDLSSRRIRRARWILSAVRQGQPLAAVLGQQVERGLAEANLQQYLAALRKLTRFRTGSKLEGFEETLRLTANTLADAKATLAAQKIVAEEAAAPLTEAKAVVDRATTAHRIAETALKALVDARATAQGKVDADLLRIATVRAHPPATRTHTHTVNVP